MSVTIDEVTADVAPPELAPASPPAPHARPPEEERRRARVLLERLAARAARLRAD